MALALLGWSGGVALADQAGSFDPTAGALAPTFHGFASQGFLYSTANNYLAESSRGSFELAEAGLNATVQLDDRVRTGMQLFARHVGSKDDYRTKLDWFYIDYRWKDWLGVRAGRVKLPFGLYNDAVDIDASHTPALLPQSVYPTNNRDFLLAQTGVELYGYRLLGAAGAVEYRANFGTIVLEAENDPNSGVTILDLGIPYVAGAWLMWEPPVDGLRIGASSLITRLEFSVVREMDPTPIEIDLPAELWVVSVEYARDELHLAAEYGRWHTRIESSDPMTFPESSTVSERGYAMASYRLRPWLQPGAYYSLYYPDVSQRTNRSAKQHDVAATLRFDLTPNWLLKLEGHYMYGTAALSPRLNDGAPLQSLERNWGLLVAKTTAYF